MQADFEVTGDECVPTDISCLEYHDPSRDPYNGASQLASHFNLYMVHVMPLVITSLFTAYLA